MKRRTLAWAVRVAAVLVAVLIAWPAVRTLRAAEAPMPLPATTWSHSPAQVTARSVSAPRALAPNTVSIPELDVQLPFHDAGITGGWLDLDASITTGVHLDNGSSLAKGSFLVAAHVNSKDLSLSPFAKLWKVEPGTMVYVSDAQGSVHAFKTTVLQHYDKNSLPSDLWRTDGAPRVVLVTCGGELTVGDDGRRHYAENVVVEAVPASPTA